MGRYYHAGITAQSDGVTTLTIGFGEPASNERIVPDAIESVAQLGLKGGKGLKIDGPASIPVAMAIAHAVGHIFGFVACYDPKLSQFVVAISHDPAVQPGHLLD
jgi:CRISPR-associated protein Csx3